ncbi:hypothetical protein Tco_1048904 [Tanacetum coccineum]
MVNGEVQLQALVDRQKIVVTEATVRRYLQLEDADGVDCLPNATIFEQLTFMSMVKNLDNAVKFLMYPRFVQVFLNNQLEGMATHNRIYIAPSHTKNIFTNMRRKGKDFSGRETPLFSTMVVQAQEEICEGSTMPTDPHHPPIITQPSSSQTKKNKNQEEGIRRRTLRFLSLVFLEIASLKKRVKGLEKKGGLRTNRFKRLYKIGRAARVVSSDEASLGNQEDASKHRRNIDDIDADAEITLVNETQGRHDDDLMFNTVTTAGEVVTTANVEVSTASPTAATITNVELTLAQTLAELKSARPKTKRVVMPERSESITTTTIRTTIPSKDKGKGIIVEEPLKMKKKD